MHFSVDVLSRMWFLFFPPPLVKEVMILSVQVFEGSVSDILNRADFQQVIV